MDDDFNIAPALAALFQFTHEINIVMDNNGLSDTDRDKILDTMKRVDSVLGVMDLKPASRDRDVDALIEEREQARKKKDWSSADRLREELKGRGIEVVDTKDGPVWRKTSS
jgi:cysteinyl-tRNA synthetase